MTIQAQAMYFKEDLNQMIRTSDAHIVKVEQCLGQRYIGCGTGGKQITIYGTPGNALGAYLDGSEILVFGNAQDATGDTMNDGAIYVYGSAGDATGYAMRGGKIFVQGDAGYRCGIHMKAYQDKSPLLLIGGSAGSFWANIRQAAPLSSSAFMRMQKSRSATLCDGHARWKNLFAV